MEEDGSRQIRFRELRTLHCKRQGGAGVRGHAVEGHGARVDAGVGGRSRVKDELGRLFT